MEQRDGSVIAGGKIATDKRGRVRRSWTMEQNRKIVAQTQVAGASVALIAQCHGIRPALISFWRRQLSRVTKSATQEIKFAAVRIGMSSMEGVIEIDLGSGCVRVRGIVDGAMLREVLAAAR